jgi:hypothetical protein
MPCERLLCFDFIPTKLYTIAELASVSSLSSDTVRGLFRDEPGVLKISRPKRGFRTYETLRIPGIVATRKFRSLTNGGQP